MSNQAKRTNHELSGGHGHNTRLYHIWLDMRHRCYGKNHNDWSYYGGRGICVCDEWDEYIVFHLWSMKSGYREDLTLGRKDNSGNYEPSNCVWETRKDQARNKRNNHLVTINGITKPLAEWAENMGISYPMIRTRIYRGMSDIEALTR